MTTKANPFIAATAAAAGAILLAGSAHAVDVRSWDQKINDASKRFVVLAAFNDEAVLDKETQLVWQRRVSNADTFHWNAWLTCSTAATGGRMGWRLPTVAELTSLIDPSVTSGPKLPAGNPFQTLSGTPLFGWMWFWTSTFDRTSPQDPASPASYRYYVMRLDTAEVAANQSAIDRYYICVRGPDSSDAN